MALSNLPAPGPPIKLALPETTAGAGTGASEWQREQRLGAGSSAEVWSVTCHGVRAALKVGRPEFALAFAREARALALACSDRLPALLGCGSLESTTHGSPPEPYLLLSLVAGLRLDEAWHKTRALEALARAVARDVGRAVANLHSVGLTHGDLKPANILVEPQGDDFVCTLVDLGLSAPLGARTPLGGSLRYLPRALQQETEPRARDLFALGITLIEVLFPATRAWQLPCSAEEFRSLGLPRWLEPLISERPGARPRAAWLSRYHLASADIRAAERCYLTLRHQELLDAAANPLAPVLLTGLSGGWLRRAHALLHQAHLLEPHPITSVATGAASRMDSLSPFQQREWLVRLYGRQAADFALRGRNDDELAAQLLNGAPESDARLPFTRSALRTEASRSEHVGASTEAKPALTETELALRLGAETPDDEILEQAEVWALGKGAPSWLALRLASLLKRRGELARALSLLRTLPGLAARTERASALARLGSLQDAAIELEAATPEEVRAASLDAQVDAKAQLARLRIHQGDLVAALGLLKDLPNSFTVYETRISIALTQGELAQARELLEQAAGLPTSEEQHARLAALRANAAQQSNDAVAALRFFREAADHAARAGSVLEEATYLAGGATSALDLGESAEALRASERAVHWFGHLELPHLAARAALTYAATLSVLGAESEALPAAQDAIARAAAAKDSRCQAFGYLVLAEVDASARDSALDAARDLLTPCRDADQIRIACRRAEAPSALELMQLDQSALQQPRDVQLEWWAARAAWLLRAPRRENALPIFENLESLRFVAVPVESVGRAFAFGAELATKLGDGKRARSFTDTALRALDSFLRGAPEDLRAAIDSRPWVRLLSGNALRAASDASGAGQHTPLYSSGQVRELEQLILALGERERLQALLVRVVDSLVLWTGVERGLLLLRAPNGTLQPRAARNLSRSDLSGEQRHLSMSLAEQAYRSNECVVAVDASGELASFHESVHALRLRSVLAVPLSAKNETLGVVYLDDRMRAGAFGADETAWAKLVASLAAVAIIDARSQLLLRRAARKAERRSAEKAQQLDAAEAALARTALELERVRSPQNRENFAAIVGQSEPLLRLLSLVERVANSDVPVLIHGESGSGKELVARSLHSQSPRRSRPFVAENCTAIPETLLESALFGHVKGAFTGASFARAGLFEQADGGTLFLDEIADMTLAMQAKLLRVIESGELRRVGSERGTRVNVRVVGASHQNLNELVKQGRFREDLLYRLNVITLEVPALRERTGDVPVLVQYFLKKYLGSSAKTLHPETSVALKAYAWPGNVRQLENEIRRAIVLSDEVIRPEHLSDAIRAHTETPNYAGLDLKQRVDALESELISRALLEAGGNQTKAAQLLGVSRFGLQKMLKRLNLQRV